MATKSQQPKGREGILSLLNATIEAINLAKEASSITPAQAAFSAAGAPLTMVKVPFPPFAMRCSKFTRSQESMINALDYVGLGLFCVNICKALDRRMDGKRLDGLSRSVLWFRVLLSTTLLTAGPLQNREGGHQTERT